MLAAPEPSDRPWFGYLGQGGWRAAVVATFVACVWLNQSVGLLSWERIRSGVFTDPAAHIADTLRYPLIFLYRHSSDEAMYYGTAAQILGQPYDEKNFETHTRGSVPGLAIFDSAPPPADGHWHVPWREVRLEYPPPAIPFILAPKLVTTQFDAYARAFGVLMGLCMVGAIALAIDVLRRTGAPSSVLTARWWLGAGLLLASGALVIQRLDPIVALSMMAAVHGAVRRRPWELGLGCALAAATKVVPLLLLPVIVAADWPYWRAHLGPLGRLAAWVALGLIAGFGPMILASPTAVGDFVRYHGARGLQVESALGVVVGVARWFAGTGRPLTYSYGSFNLEGAVPDLLAKATAVITVVAVGCLVAVELRREETADEPSRVERIACAAVAGTVVLWLGGKVFSPQYLTWGIPLVLAVPGRRGTWAIALAMAALTVTQIYHRGFYDLVAEQQFVGLVTVLVRQAVLVALLVVVVRAPRDGRYGVGRAAGLVSESRA